MSHRSHHPLTSQCVAIYSAYLFKCLSAASSHQIYVCVFDSSTPNWSLLYLGGLNYLYHCPCLWDVNNMPLLAEVICSWYISGVISENLFKKRVAVQDCGRLCLRMILRNVTQYTDEQQQMTVDMLTKWEAMFTMHHIAYTAYQSAVVADYY